MDHVGHAFEQSAKLPWALSRLQLRIDRIVTDRRKETFVSANGSGFGRGVSARNPTLLDTMVSERIVDMTRFPSLPIHPPSLTSAPPPTPPHTLARAPTPAGFENDALMRC